MSKPPEQDLLISLGHAIRDRREQRNMSTKELAEATGIARPRISALEAGKLNPTYDLLIEVAEGLDTKLSALFARAEETIRN
jgi:transcriptional regulator with XRE-family HTH domain